LATSTKFYEFIVEGNIEVNENALRLQLKIWNPTAIEADIKNAIPPKTEIGGLHSEF
jgi:t-SNARE complex subunit (syntaxin)